MPWPGAGASDDARAGGGAMIRGGAILIGVIVALVAIVIGLVRGTARRRILVELVAIAHIAVVAELTLSPLPADAQVIRDLLASGLPTDPRLVNLRPFVTIAPSVRHLLRYGLDDVIVRNLLANFVLLMPLAWYGPALFPRLRNILWFTIVAIGFSSTIELAQRALTVSLGYPHSTDIDDVIVNTAGALVAFVVLGAIGLARGRPAGSEPAEGG
jgi:glycopeptide antibiotics resistance protein